MSTITSLDYRERRDITKESMLNIVSMIQDVQKEKGLSIDQAIKIYELALLDRKIDVAIDNGDVLDVIQRGWYDLISEIKAEGLSISVSQEE